MTTTPPPAAPAHPTAKPIVNPWLRVLFILFCCLPAVLFNRSGGLNPLEAGLGGGLGALVATQLPPLWQLLTGRAGGVSVITISIGTGALVARRTVRGRPVALRRIPLPMVIATGLPVQVPALRLRLWISALVTLCLQLGAGLWLALGDSVFGRFTGFGLLLIGVVSLLTAGLPLTGGWVLLRMPFLPSDALTPYVLRPAELAATLALGGGRTGEARAALEQLRPEDEPTFRTQLLRANLALVDGRYAEAATLARDSVQRTPHRKHTTVAQLTLAAAIVGAAETGELPPAEYLPRLLFTLDEVRATTPALLRYFPVGADAALLQGQRDQALKLARPPAAWAVDTFWQAQAQCTLAAALAANGRLEEAHAALARARAVVPELARTDIVTRLLATM